MTCAVPNPPIGHAGASARARHRFRPRWWSTLLVAVLVPTFVSLGQWQWDKGEHKRELQARLDRLADDAPLTLPATPLGDPDALHFRRVSLRGHYVAAGQILLDNQVLGERAGWQVLTPLAIDDGPMQVLVNRGWLPAPSDRQVPAAALTPPAGPVALTGTAIVPGKRFFSLAPDTAPPGGNALWQNLDLARYRAESPAPVQPLVVRLDPGHADGLRRDWPRPDARVERHLSYALQWFGFALASVAIWAYVGLRSGPRP